VYYKFSILDTELTTLDGLNASIYYSNVLDTYAISFAGTDPLSYGDLKTNVLQNFGFETALYKQAIDIAQRVVELAGNSKVIATGHSLGGGLASAAAVMTGINAYTFNAAGLHPNTVGLESFKNADMKNITSFTSPTDPLNKWQDRLPGLLNKSIGTRVSVPNAEGHSMESMKDALRGRY